MSQFLPKIGVVGATGAVGQVLLSLIEERKYPFSNLRLYASSASFGKKIKVNQKEFSCEVLEKGCFNGLDIVFFDISDELSLQWVPEATKAQAFVVDNSAAFRMSKKTLLCVPEINGAQVLERVKIKDKLSWEEKIFSCPNCSTAQLVLALYPLHKKWGLKRVVVSTYQSVSGAGYRAVEELKNETLNFLEGKKPEAKEFAYPMPFNCIPQIGGVQKDGYTSEENKMMRESGKILGLPELKITATAIRVPTLYCHSESVNIELEKPFELNEIKKALSEQEGVQLLDDTEKKVYPMPMDAASQDPVFIGRIRKDFSAQNALQLWVVADNLRKGAALNAIQIGEKILGAIR